MVISNVVGQQYAFLLPVGLVIVCAVLVFAFGFKSSVEPPNFKQLSLTSDERKSLKRKKLKEKKAQTNGHATVIIDDSEGKAKPLKQSNKSDSNKIKKVEEAKKDNQKSPAKVEKRSGKENQETPKGKKNERKFEEKPSDFDEGEWETAFSRKDKKNRKKEDDLTVSTPEKTPKKKSGENKSPKKEKNISDEKTQSPKKSNQQNKTPVSSPKQKKVNETKENVSKGSPEKKNKSKTGVHNEEKAPAPASEVKPQRSTQKEKKSNESPGNSTKAKTLGESGNSHPESEPSLNENDDQWKEAPQKKSKKKVRKD